MNAAKVLGMIIIGLSGIATVGLALGVLGLVVFLGYKLLGILGAFLAFWLGGGLAFGIVNLTMLPIRAIGVALVVFGDKETPTISQSPPTNSAGLPQRPPSRPSTLLEAPVSMPPPPPIPPSLNHDPSTSAVLEEVTTETTDRQTLPTLDWDELRSELPTLPPVVPERRLDVTSRTFTAWDQMKPWEVTAVAFLRDDDGAFTVWTPGNNNGWVWRGPVRLLKESAKLLADWLTHGEDAVGLTVPSGIESRTQVTNDTILLWDPDPNQEGRTGLLRFDGGFELSLMMAGLRRGGAFIDTEGGDILAQWLITDTGM